MMKAGNRRESAIKRPRVSIDHGPTHLGVTRSPNRVALPLDHELDRMSGPEERKGDDPVQRIANGLITDRDDAVARKEPRLGCRRIRWRPLQLDPAVLRVRPPRDRVNPPDLEENDETEERCVNERECSDPPGRFRFERSNRPRS